VAFTGGSRPGPTRHGMGFNAFVVRVRVNVFSVSYIILIYDIRYDGVRYPAKRLTRLKLSAKARGGV